MSVVNFYKQISQLIGLYNTSNYFTLLIYVVCNCVSEDFSYSYYDLRIKQISYDFFLLNQVFLTFIFLYINYYLKDSTYNVSNNYFTYMRI